MRKKPISTGSEWSFELLLEYDQVIAEIAAEYGLETYPNQIEIISAEQMLDAYSSIGMPVNYSHWSFGKHFLQTEKQYKRGHMGLAYEIVINSNPCIAYLMEENTMAMQALVIAHACYGHNSFFKNNYLFTSWTSADAIIDYLLFAKNYVSECEEKYGIEAVESTLDACHAIMNYGVDRYKRPAPLSMKEEQERQKSREDYLQSQLSELWKTLPSEKQKNKNKNKEAIFPSEPQENLLYFFEKNAPHLEIWQREIIRIIRKVAQYFYPQRQTKVMNEGWATFWHYTLINTLYDRGYITEGFMMEFLQSHTAVVYQPSFDSPYYNGINPYALGFNMFLDIRRICENPTDEDKEWFPEFAGSDWKTTLHNAMRNYKDESFIEQFLSPKIMRDFKLFGILDDDAETHLEISAIHDEYGYRSLRQNLAKQYDLSLIEPNIQVYRADVRGDRSLTLRYYQQNRRGLNQKTASEVLRHVYKLWGFPVILESIGDDGEILKSFSCPEVKQHAADKEPS